MLSSWVFISFRIKPLSVCYIFLLFTLCVCVCVSAVTMPKCCLFVFFILFLYNLVTWQLYSRVYLHWNKLVSSTWFPPHQKSVFLWDYVEDWMCVMPGLGMEETANEEGLAGPCMHSHPALLIVLSLCSHSTVQCGNGPWLQVIPLTRLGEADHPFTMTSSVALSSLQSFPLPNKTETYMHNMLLGTDIKSPGVERRWGYSSWGSP